jgi:hypothetical protein
MKSMGRQSSDHVTAASIMTAMGAGCMGAMQQLPADPLPRASYTSSTHFSGSPKNHRD